MKLTNEIYLNCGIYENPVWDPAEACYISIPLLFIAKPGYFASDAWLISDDAYNSITGMKFEGVTSDDCKPWLLERSKIRRIANDNELNNIFLNSCKEFQELFNTTFIYETRKKNM